MQISSELHNTPKGNNARIFINFRDLNKASRKDDFHQPCRDSGWRSRLRTVFRTILLFDPKR